MRQHGVLVVDDDAGWRETISDVIQQIELDLDVVEVTDRNHVREWIGKRNFGAIVLDVNLDEGVDLEIERTQTSNLIRQVHRDFPDVKWILLTAHGTLSFSVHAFQDLDVFAFFQKQDFSERIDRFQEAVRRALESQAELVDPSLAVQKAEQRYQRYNLGTIRQLLKDAFTAKELWRFCQEHPRFKLVLANISPQSSLEDMIDFLLEYSEKRVLFSELLEEVQRANPRQYDRYRPQLFEDKSMSNSSNNQELTREGIQPRKSSFGRWLQKRVSGILDEVIASVLLAALAYLIGSVTGWLPNDPLIYIAISVVAVVVILVAYIAWQRRLR